MFDGLHSESIQTIVCVERLLLVDNSSRSLVMYEEICINL